MCLSEYRSLTLERLTGEPRRPRHTTGPTPVLPSHSAVTLRSGDLTDEVLIGKLVAPAGAPVPTSAMGLSRPTIAAALLCGPTAVLNPERSTGVDSVMSLPPRPSD